MVERDCIPIALFASIALILNPDRQSAIENRKSKILNPES